MRTAGQSPHELPSICATSATDRQIDFPRSIGPILARRYVGSRLGNYVELATDRGDTHANRDTVHATARRPREEASDPADGNIAWHSAKDRATDRRIRSASASVQAARRSEARQAARGRDGQIQRSPPKRDRAPDSAVGPQAHG